MRTIVMLAALTAGEASKPKSSPDLEARCTQLVAYYDRYGASRSADSDGRRNHTRIGAEIDCNRGRYREGIETMKRLLVDKKFSVPPPGPSVVPDDD
ncbi:hypothetical protein [Reyranella sp.]|uniref:hypothetical protein n=1 Tax=Reyranella sp. TaxID=1929291 RepID=UPI003BAC4B94